MSYRRILKKIGDIHFPPSTLALKSLNAVLIFLGSVILVRSWIENVHSYLVLPLYVAGDERMPYQGRFLMMFLMRWLGSLRMVHLWCAHFQARKLGDPLYMSIFLVSVPALLLAMYCITWTYRSFSKHQQLAWLVPWVLLYGAQSTYVVRYTGCGKSQCQGKGKK